MVLSFLFLFRCAVKLFGTWKGLNKTNDLLHIKKGEKDGIASASACEWVGLKYTLQNINS